MTKTKSEGCPKCCTDVVVVLSRCMAMTCLILNCMPWTIGWGTAIAACAGEKFRCDTLLHGFLQNLCAGVIVGWVWAILYGTWLLKAAKD